MPGQAGAALPAPARRQLRRGLVTRTPGDNDRRIVTLALTPAGHGTLAGSSGTDDVRDIITSRLTGDEIEQLAGLLRRLLAGTQGGTAVAARFPSPGPAPPPGSQARPD